MKTQRMLYALISIFLLAVTALSGCSSGTGGGESAVSPPLAVATATGGLLKLGTAGTPNLIAGIDITVNLPAGVSVNADPATGEVTSGAVAVSGAAGANTLVVARQIPATGGKSAQVRIILVNAAGFGLGEFATIRFDLAAGAGLPAPGAFTMANFSAKGIDGAALSGVYASPLSVEAAARSAIKTLITVVGTPAPDLTMTVDNATRFTSQTITGTLKTGLTLTVTVTAPAVVSGLTITVTNTGIDNWSALVSSLVTGTNTVTAIADDGAGNITVATADIVVDNVPPFINIDTTLSTRIGSIGISGSAELYSIITVTCDHITAGMGGPINDIPNNLTQWSAMILGLVEGVNHCVVTAVDAAGNVNAVKADITRDSTPPSLSISATTPAKTGGTETVTGTVEAGTTPTVTASTAATVGPVTVTGSTWSCTVSGLPSGDTAVTVTAKDALGNVTTTTATITAVTPNGSFSGAPKATVSDALKALRIAAGLDVATPTDIVHADLYADNFIDLADAILILEDAIGLFDNVLGFNNLYPHLLSAPRR